MDRIRSLGRRFSARLRADSGAVAAEYGLVLALIALAVIVAMGLFGLALLDLFERGPDAFPAS
jgi:Flp pilus assembly pilin Flp